MKKSFISLLKKALFIPPFIMILVIVTVWAFQEYWRLERYLSEESERLLEERRNFIRERVSVADSFIDFQRQSVKSRKMAEMKSRISDVSSIIEAFQQNFPLSGTGNEKKAVRTLENMEFGECGFFIFRDDGDIIFMSRGSGCQESFCSYNVPVSFISDEIRKKIDGNDDSILFVNEKNEKGISRLFCVKRISSAGWIIGLQASSDDLEKEAMNSVNDWLSRLESRGRNSFMFIADRHGRILSHTGMLAQKKSVNAISPVSQGMLASDEIRLLSESSGAFCEMTWRDGSIYPGRKSIVSSFQIPDWGWITGLGVFTDDMEQMMQQRKAVEMEKFVNSLHFPAIVLVMLIISGFMLSKRIAGGFERNFILFDRFFTEAKKTGKIISGDEMAFREFESMAEAANSMLEARQSTESRLRQSESNFSCFFNSIGDAIFVADENLHIISMNPAAKSLAGACGQSRNMRHVSDCFDSGIIEGINKFIAGENSAMNEKTCYLGHGCILVGTDQEKTVENFIFEGVWNSDRAFFILARDISVLVASEEKFSKIFSESSVMMSVSTIEEGRFVDVNKSAAELLEHPREYFIGKTSVEAGIFADPTWRDKVVPIIKRYGRVRNEEVEFVTGTGKRRYCLLSMDIIAYAGSRYILTVANDITERKKSEYALLKTKEDAVRSKVQLEDTLRELELFNRFMMDREERIIALKAEVNSLKKERGDTPLYAIEDIDE